MIHHLNFISSQIFLIGGFTSWQIRKYLRTIFKLIGMKIFWVYSDLVVTTIKLCKSPVPTIIRNGHLAFHRKYLFPCFCRYDWRWVFLPITFNNLLQILVFVQRLEIDWMRRMRLKYKIQEQWSGVAGMADGIS